MNLGRRATLAVLFSLSAAVSAFAQDDDTLPLGTPSDAATLIAAQRVIINYDFKLGGFSLGSGQLRATFTDDTYEAHTDLRTGGLADWLFQSRYVNTSAGARHTKRSYSDRT